VTPQRSSDRTGDDAPKFRDEDWLRDRYAAADGNVSAMHRAIDADIPYRTLLNNLKAFGIHDPENPPGRRAPSTPPEDDEPDDDQEEDDEPAPEPTPAVDESDSATGAAFEPAEWADLDTPSWLEEGSFYSAVEFADTFIDLKKALGWDEVAEIGRLVDALGLEGELEGYAPGDWR